MGFLKRLNTKRNLKKQIKRVKEEIFTLRARYQLWEVLPSLTEDLFSLKQELAALYPVIKRIESENESKREVDEMRAEINRFRAEHDLWSVPHSYSTDLASLQVEMKVLYAAAAKQQMENEVTKQREIAIAEKEEAARRERLLQLDRELAIARMDLQKAEHDEQKRKDELALLKHREDEERHVQAGREQRRDQLIGGGLIAAAAAAFAFLAAPVVVPVAAAYATVKTAQAGAAAYHSHNARKVAEIGFQRERLMIENGISPSSPLLLTGSRSGYSSYLVEEA